MEGSRKPGSGSPPLLSCPSAAQPPGSAPHPARRCPCSEGKGLRREQGRWRGGQGANAALELPTRCTQGTDHLCKPPPSPPRPFPQDLVSHILLLRGSRLQGCSPLLGWQMLAGGGDPSWPQGPREMLFAARAALMRKMHFPSSSGGDRHKQGESHQVTGKRRAGRWVGKLRAPEVRCHGCVVALSSLSSTLTARRPSHKLRSPNADAGGGGKCRASLHVCLAHGLDVSMVQSEARDFQESAGFCAWA